MMNQVHLHTIISKISTELNSMKILGKSITNDFIEETVDHTFKDFKKIIPNFDFETNDIKTVKFKLRNMFNITVEDQSIILSNPNAERWFDNKKSQILWKHWDAYKKMLISDAIPLDVIDKNEEVIDQVLDLSMDPTNKRNESRKGLVMGNVQSGKTLNYLGLINKAIDVGYKIIIVLGGHLNELRQQTQERIDAGVLGRESKHLVRASTKRAEPIGVGLFADNKVDYGTTTIKDFSKASSSSFGRNLDTNGDPFIFTVKKNTNILIELYEWISEYHFLDPENGKKINAPLMLIDDEADYASINTKHHKEDVTVTNDAIRKLLSLFNKNTYVGYTATPFANIFIDPDESYFNKEDDLFPSDFMIRLPTPPNYMGQDFFFSPEVIENVSENYESDSTTPVVIINDHEPIYELKSDAFIPILPESLKKAIRTFIIVIAIRNIRGFSTRHNTMLVNISHLKTHQDRLETLIDEYKNIILDALSSFASLSLNEAIRNPVIKELKNTFDDVLEVPETFEQVFSKLFDSTGKVKVWAINQRASSKDNKSLDYSAYKEFGLNVIAIGGHKLSRGLTLEDLTISYFARNSKMYDTLMQMCRWFGYREEYKDLCKVFLPYESLDWYSFISQSINELYGELKLMARSEKRPRDFGLKVREHPGSLLITAKNKIGFSDTEIRSQSLWGQVQRRFTFYSSEEKNERNLLYAEQLINKLLKDQKNIEHDQNIPYIFDDVEYADLINFINNIDLPEDDVGNEALIHHLKGMESAGLPKVKVALFTQASSGSTKWEKYLSEQDQKFINTKFSFCSKNIVMPKRAMKFVNGNLYQTPNMQLGNSDDEKIFLSSNSIDEVKANCGKKKAVSFDYMACDERDFPGLIIYLFAIAIKTPWGKLTDNSPLKVRLGHGQNATLGYSISLPRSEEIKNKTKEEIKEIITKTKHKYRINKVQQRFKEVIDYTENFEDDD